MFYDVNFLSKADRNWTKKGFKKWIRTIQKSVRSGSKMNQKWVGKDQKWVTNASDLGNRWIRKMSGDVDMSQTLVRSWSEVGQK